MWSVIFALAIGAIYASLLYLFSKKYGRGLTVLLFALRTIVVATVVMLFINPYIKQKTYKIEQPIVVIAQDNSESIILNKDSVFYKTKYPKLVDSIVNLLEKNYDVEELFFGAAVIPSAEGARKPLFTEQFTNISAALSTIQRQFYKKNVGAVLLLSDGIVNQGVNPELSIENYPFPIYAVTLGDTVAYPGMTIKEVRYNKTVQANMLFPLRVTANATNFKGHDMNVIVKMDGADVENIVVPVTSNRFSKTFDFNIDSGDEGVKNIEIFLTPNVETFPETSLQRDAARPVTTTRRVFITVTDKKYRVLCVAGAPHPDIAAVKSALDDHFEFEVRYDENVDNWNHYDLVIYHQFARTRHATSLRVPTLTIVGTNTDFDAFNESQDIVKIGRGAANTNLDVRGRFNNSFGLFTINSDIKNELKSYPPLALPHCEIAFNAHHDDVLLMNIMDLETPNPLLAFANDNEGNKHAFIFGTGCWRWKLYEYFHHHNNDGFNELFSKTVKYLLTEKDKELTINHKDSYLNTEQIVLTAELRNPSRELINEPDLQISINNAYDYVFSKGENNYNLNIGMLPEGIYNYRAHTSFGGVEYNASGTFTVESLGVEAQDLTADVERMRSLATQTGGRHYYITDIQQVISDIENDESITSIAREETRYDDLINLKWLFFSILALITIEWVLRKVFGVY
ncbi:MAG: hypothetical protein J5686_03410 [Bacteroidales bacterium]|nr:hypothetical protein [Bacteroidales bacterium]